MTRQRDESPRSDDPFDPNTDAFEKAFDRSFALLAFAMNRHLIDHMMRCTRELDVDFESLVIWGLLSHLNVAHLVPPGSAPTSVLDEWGRLAEPANQPRPLRLRDLEQISRLPRETIRRKLKGLERKGYVERHGDGWMFSRTPIEPDLRDFSRETLRRLLALDEELRRLLAAGHTQASRAAASMPEDRGD